MLTFQWEIVATLRIVWVFTCTRPLFAKCDNKNRGPSNDPSDAYDQQCWSLIWPCFVTMIEERIVRNCLAMRSASFLGTRDVGLVFGYSLRVLTLTYDGLNTIGTKSMHLPLTLLWNSLQWQIFSSITFCWICEDWKTLRSMCENKQSWKYEFKDSRWRYSSSYNQS